MNPILNFIYKKEKYLILLFIIFIVGVNSLPYVAGAINTPKGYIYLGTVHWPPDYFYYLSQFTQGQKSPFLGTDLFTGEYRETNALEWVNMALGNIFSKVGIGAIGAYQLSIVIFAFLFLVFSYLTIKEVFHGNDRKSRVIRILVFFLFVLNNAFPVFSSFKFSFPIAYHDFYFNYGVLFTRLGVVPHHLIFRTCIAVSLFIFFRYLRVGWCDAGRPNSGAPRQASPFLLLIKQFFSRYTKVLIISVILLITGFVSSSINPVEFSLICAVFVIGILIKNTPQFLQDTLTIKSFKKLLSENIPFILFILAGIPWIVYLKNLISFLPYSASANWEAGQIIKVNLINLIFSLGPAAVMSLPAFLYVFWKRKIQIILPVIFVLMTLFLFYSSIPIALHTSNARVISPFTIFFLSILCGFSIEFIYNLNQKYGKMVIGIIIILFTSINILVSFSQLKERMRHDINYSYIRDEDMKIINYVKKEKSKDKLYLSEAPFKWFIPALSGGRVYEGHELLTIDYPKKHENSVKFFSGQTSESEMRDFLNKEKITRVVAPLNSAIAGNGSLRIIYKNDSWGVYGAND